jgi:hypothetical protein
MLQVSALLTRLNIEHKYYEYTPKIALASPVFIICILKKQARKKISERDRILAYL